MLFNSTPSLNQAPSLNAPNLLEGGNSGSNKLDNQQTSSMGDMMAQPNAQTPSLSNQNNYGMNQKILGNTQNQQLNQTPLGLQNQSNVRDHCNIFYFTKSILKEFIRIL